MPESNSSTILEGSFVPRRGLRGAQRQTILGTLLPRPPLPPGEERVVRVDARAQLLLRCHWQPERQRALTLLMVHGLEGSSQSPYVLGVGHKALAAGFNLVRMNVRNCGGTAHLSQTLYHSGLSRDVQQVAGALIKEDKLPRLALVGYSMGGNMVLKALGEWSREAPHELVAAAVVCPSMDLAPGAALLERGTNRLYQWYFLRSLKRSYREKARLFPEVFQSAGKLGGLHTIRQFDDAITAPAMGFRDAADYYERASSSRVLERIAVPTLVVHALDDPFVPLLPATRARLEANPHITLIATQHGGHCAFLAPADGYDGRWAERRLVEFLKRF
ncbi:MAG TPA: alpha/beta fold hydrolase [Terriglobales bacterium]|nr:alpha/beta fold hydrolase [Terriglobales bacterium]